MTNEEKMLKIVEKFAADKAKKDEVEKRYKDKDKIKKLSTAERLDRIEEILKIKLSIMPPHILRRTRTLPLVRLSKQTVL